MQDNHPKSSALSERTHSLKFAALEARSELGAAMGADITRATTENNCAACLCKKRIDAKRRSL
jgi:hypothetical protein